LGAFIRSSLDARQRAQYNPLLSAEDKMQNSQTIKDNKHLVEPQ